MTVAGADTPALDVSGRGDLWRRHPSDTARLAVAGIVALALIALAAVQPDGVRSVSADLVELARHLPRPVRVALLGLSQLAAAVGPFVGLVWLATRRRYRLAATAAGAAGLAAATMAALQGWLDRTVPPATVEIAAGTSWLTGASFPSGAYLAALTASILVLGAGATRSWRRAGTVVVLGAAIIRMASAVSVPVNVGVTLAIGAAVGSAVLVALGAPARRLNAQSVLAVARRMGLDSARITEVAVGAAHSRTFMIEGSERHFAKLIGRDERAAEMLLRTLRRLRLRGLTDERPSWSASQLVRHEALSGMIAANTGARVAPIAALGDTEEGDAVLIFEHLPGRRLIELDPSEIDETMLDEIWAQVVALRTARIAHRWLDATHILVDDAGNPHLIDLRWSALDADDQLLAIDVADLATSLSLLVGIERSVAAATAVLPAADIAEAVPFVQPLVLTPGNRAAIADRPDHLDHLRRSLTDVVRLDTYELAELQRLSWARVIGWLGTAVLAYVALAFVSNWDSIVDSFGRANWSYLPFVLALTVVGTVGSAASLLGAVARPLPFVPTIEIMYAQSFLNRFTPANAGGMALRTRYLQSHGADLTVAAASVGITSLASGLLQLAMLVVFAVWAGRSDELDFNLPGVEGLPIAMLVVLVAAGAMVATPWGRRVVFGSLVPNLAKAWTELTLLARDPVKLALLFGGSTVAKLATIVAFVLSARAFGVDESFARMALLFMTANTVASAAPTPGGVGAIEAALVAVLTGIGVEPADALSIVVVFRLMTYWIPVLPAWVALRRVRRAGVV